MTTQTIDISKHRSELRGATPEVRFWAKVDKSGGCWEWLGGTNGYGYGRFRFSSRKYEPAHRISFSLSNPLDELPDVLDHICHNRKCVNPEHLRGATKKENGENRSLESTYSKSGVRNVYWHERAGKWTVHIRHAGKTIYGGLFVELEDAKQAAIELRMKYFTHSEMDKV